MKMKDAYNNLIQQDHDLKSNRLKLEKMLFEIRELESRSSEENKLSINKGEDENYSKDELLKSKVTKHSVNIAQKNDDISRLRSAKANKIRRKIKQTMKSLGNRPPTEHKSPLSSKTEISYILKEKKASPTFFKDSKVRYMTPVKRLKVELSVKVARVFTKLCHQLLISQHLIDLQNKCQAVKWFQPSCALAYSISF